jgi:topoisomerase-4 subunit A
MAFIDKVYNKNFVEYASYVIKDRAIPHIDDGLKPVQRRILHSLYEMEDGKFHKVANAVGHCMKYHPHGDASIFAALVGLANKDMFIDKQGNFGNLYTGDEASAQRYIECRLTPLAKQTLFNTETTAYEDSYDGRNREPVVLPAKVPVLLAQGAEGIAVGMATRIVPHNFIELLQAQIAYLSKEPFKVFPDFPTGGLLDVSEYGDGNGKVRVRARLDTRDPKRILI